MDENRLLEAIRLRDEGSLDRAAPEFLRIARDTKDPIEKAGIILYATATLKALGEYNDAAYQLSVARELITLQESPTSYATSDHDRALLEVRLDFEVADLYRFKGMTEAALAAFEAMLVKYARRLSEPDFQEAYESIEVCRAFVLADLDRWREAMPILEKVGSNTEYKEGIAFYLGHCYLAARDYAKAEGRLSTALMLGLPHILEYRAHCELGIVYYELGDYARAKLELELGAENADPDYLKQSKIWRWLEVTCRKLGLRDEAQRYGNLAKAL